MSKADAEFDRQVANYESLELDPPLDLPSLAGLRDLAKSRSGLDWSLVLPRRFARMEQVIAQLQLPDRKKPGIFDRNFEDPDLYQPVDETVPTDQPYLVAGFEPGIEYLNLPPERAAAAIAERGRRPLTIEEGLAVFLHDPATLQRNACWSLAGSTRGDRRVPALWISDNAPKLGWCFAGAPHTWLGTASISERITA